MRRVLREESDPVAASLIPIERVLGQMGNAIVHGELLSEHYGQRGGDLESFANADDVLAEMYGTLGEMMREGDNCRYCGEVVDDGHLLLDFFKFSDHLYMLKDYRSWKRMIMQLPL